MLDSKIDWINSQDPFVDALGNRWRKVKGVNTYNYSTIEDNVCWAEEKPVQDSVLISFGLKSEFKVNGSGNLWIFFEYISF